MKGIKILIASLLLASQSYAFSKSDRNFLVAITAGTIISYALLSNDTNSKRGSHSKTVYVNNHHKKHYKKSHHKSKKYSHYVSNHRYYKEVDFRHNKHERSKGSKYASYNLNHRSHRYRD